MKICNTVIQWQYNENYVILNEGAKSTLMTLKNVHLHPKIQKL